MQWRTLQDLAEDFVRRPVEKGGHVYHPIPFEEFNILKTSSDSQEANAKLEKIRRFALQVFPAGLAGLRILDVGANAGFYSFSLAKEGAHVTAFEPHPRYGPAGEFIARLKRLPVDWIRADFNERLLHGRRFDCALMLSVFQWMADGGKSLGQACRDLQVVSRRSSCMVFELGFNAGLSCLRTKNKNHYAALIDLLRSHTDYVCFKALGRTRPWKGAARHLIACSNNPDYDDHVLRRLLRSLRI